MSWFEKIITSGVEKVIDSAASGLDKLFTSDEERLKVQVILDKVKAELITNLVSAFTRVLKLQSDIIIAEIKGESWIQRNWRPITMLLFAYIIANEYVIAPYVQVMFNVDLKPKAIDPEMWGLLKLGMGGYVSALGIKKMLESTKWAK